MTTERIASLTEKLDTAIASGDRNQRHRMLREITDLFVGQAAHLDAPQIGVIGEVMARLAHSAHDDARQELSERISSVANAPRTVVLDLAMDQQIAVARPVLMNSPALGDDDLVWVATERGQDHLLAIAERSSLSEGVSEVVVARGDASVRCAVGANRGVRLSDVSRETLRESSTRDPVLAAALESQAGWSFDSGRAARLNGRGDESNSNAAAMTAAMRAVSDLPAEEITETLMIELAAHNISHALAVFCHLCSIRVEMLDRLTSNHAAEAVLIIGKSAGLSLKGVMAVVTAVHRWNGESPANLSDIRTTYLRLHRPTAERITHFWLAREAAGRV